MNVVQEVKNQICCKSRNNILCGLWRQCNIFMNDDILEFRNSFERMSSHYFRTYSISHAVPIEAELPVSRMVWLGQIHVLNWQPQTSFMTGSMAAQMYAINWHVQWWLAQNQLWLSLQLPLRLIRAVLMINYYPKILYYFKNSNAYCIRHWQYIKCFWMRKTKRSFCSLNFFKRA